jgi:hypothetical protein
MHWRTQVHVLSVGAHDILVSVPAWTSPEIARVPTRDLPADVASALHEDLRLYAEARLGAKSAQDLAFRNWTL